MTDARQTTYIESIGVYLPPREVSSEKRVAGIESGAGIPLERLTGIASTRRAPPDEFSFDLAFRAIGQSLDRSKFRPEDIGLLIACNISKYDREGFVFTAEPNTATVLRKSFGFRNALAFDLNNACAGMFTGIIVADAFLYATGIKAAMVVSGEYISHLADTAQRELKGLSDPSLACLTLGDAGAAVVLGRSPDGSVGFQYLGIRTFGAHSGLCIGGPARYEQPGAIMLTDSMALLKVGSVETARHFLHSVREHGWDLESIDHVIPHQVSKSGTESLIREINAGLNGEELRRGKVINNLAKRGNTASTAHLVAFHDHMENERIAAGDRVVFSLTASGLTVGTALYVMDELPARVRNNTASEAAAATDGHAVSEVPVHDPDAVSVVSVATTRTRAEVPQSSEEIATAAAEACLSRSPCHRQDIGVLIFAGVFKSGFISEPSLASILAGRLFPDSGFDDGNHLTLAFDIHHGPNGFLAACEIVRAMIARGQVRAGLVIAAEFENNRLLAGYPQVGIAEVASAAVVMPFGTPGIGIADCRFHSFDEHQDDFRADNIGTFPTHVKLEAAEGYTSALRTCICKSVDAYLTETGRRLEDFDEFYFPQLSSGFLCALGKDLGVESQRVVDVTVEGKDLYTSSLPCLLETAAARDGKLCLAVTAGPGINVACAIVRR